MSEEQRPRAKPWLLATAITFLLLVGLPILGFGIGLISLIIRENVAVGRWQPLGSPPEPPVEFVDAGLYRVYVRGQDGSLFECAHMDEPIKQDECWKSVEQPESPGYRVQYGYDYGSKTPSPPGPVVETFGLKGYPYRENSTYARYILLEDGSVWVWKHHSSPMPLILAVMGGLFFGLALAVVLIVTMWLVVGVRALVRRRRMSIQASQDKQQ